MSKESNLEAVFTKNSMSYLAKKNLKAYLLYKKDEYNNLLENKPSSKLYQEGKIEAIYQILNDLDLLK